MKKIILGLFVFSFLFVGFQVHSAIAQENPSVTLESNPSVDINGYANINLGDSITFTGFPNNLTGQNGVDYTMSFNFDPIFNDVCNQDGIHILSQKCIPTQAGTGTFSIQVTQNGHVYDSNVIRVIVTSNTSASPSITVLTPNGRDMYEVGQQINVTWNSTGISASSNNIDITLHGYNANGVIVWSKELSSFTLNDGQEKVILPTYLGGVPFGKNFVISVGTDSTNNPSPIYDFSDTTFTIGPATDVTNGGCSNGEVYSSTSGQPCPTSGTPSITVLSPNGGEVYQAGQQITVKYKMTNNDSQVGDKVSVFLKSLYDNSIYNFGSFRAEVVGDDSIVLTIPTNSNLVTGNYYKISARFTGSNGFVSQDESDNYFTINSSTTTTTDTGCSAGSLFSLITGSPCGNNNLPAGCTSNSGYSSTTGVSCSGTQNVTTTTDLTPRISYWYGKVNQHVDITKKSEFDVSGATWQTDSDGVSGADLDKLTYCKKFYPNTTSVVEYKNEVINSWHDRGNLNNYTSTKMSYACVSGSIIDNGCTSNLGYSSTTGQSCQNNRDPYVNLVYPQTGSTFKAGQNVEIKIDSNLTRFGAFRAMIYRVDLNNRYVFVKKFDTANSGIQTLQIPFGTPAGEYKIDYGHIFSDNDYTQYGTATFYVTSDSIIDNDCTNGDTYSSTTGQLCLNKVSEIDGGCNGIYKYSLMTGKLCSNFTGVYTGTNTSTITTPITRTLKLGIKGDDVKALQAFLNLLADGSFGPKTQAKVIEWQVANGLTPDGAFGSISRQKAGLAQ